MSKNNSTPCWLSPGPQVSQALGSGLPCWWSEPWEHWEAEKPTDLARSEEETLPSSPSGPLPQGSDPSAPPGGRIPSAPVGSGYRALPRSKERLPASPTLHLPPDHPRLPCVGQRWLLLERAAGSSAVLPFYFSWDTQGDVGTATGVVRGSPVSPPQQLGKGRGPGALVLGWSSHCGPWARWAEG